MLGPTPYFAKALASVGTGVLTVWDGKTRLPRNFRELEADPVHFRRLDSLDAMSLAGTASVANALAGLIRSESIDVIHANSMKHLAVGYAAALLARRWTKRRTALVISIHNPRPWLTPRLDPATKLRAQVIMACADLAIPIAERMREKLILAGMDPQRSSTVHVCLDLASFDAKKNLPVPYAVFARCRAMQCPIVTYVAALQPWKGHATYLTAAREVVDRLGNADFLLVGNGVCRTSLEELACKLNLVDHTTFLGDVPPEIIPAIFALSDLSVCASNSEMLPAAVLEAMAAGRPVVATSVGGIPEILENGSSGLLVAPSDAGGMAAAICDLLADPAKRRRMGQAGRQSVVAHNSLEVTGKQLTDAYQRAQQYSRVDNGK